MAFHEAALDLRQETIGEKEEDAALHFSVWAGVSNRYGLRVVGLRAEFYKMSAKDPTYAKLVMPTLERRNEIAAADDLQESMNKLETHLSTQLMKAVATLSASNATKRAGKGGVAGEKWSNWKPTPPLERDATLRRRMVSFGLFGVLTLGDPLWDLRPTQSSICPRRGPGARRYPADRIRQGLCWCRPRRRMPHWHVQGGNAEACCSSETGGSRYIFQFRCMAGWTRGEEGPIYCKPCATVQEMAIGDCEDGLHSAVCDGSSEG